MSNPEEKEIPEVKPYQWISIGKDGSLDAVVVREHESKIQGDVQVIYINHKRRATMKSVSWTGSHWEFWTDDGDATYLDKTDRRYHSFITQAEEGRN